MKPNVPLLTLAISHNIHLNQDQRRRLASGDSIGVVGVSVPVWFSKGKTNEPAREVFCNYIIHNFAGIDDLVHMKLDGYEFNIPQLPKDFVMPQELTNEEWANLLPEEREAVLEERHVPIHGKNLLDVKEGGSCGLSFSRTDHGRIKGIPTSILHVIRIGSVEELRESMVS